MSCWLFSQLSTQSFAQNLRYPVYVCFSVQNLQVFENIFLALLSSLNPELCLITLGFLCDVCLSARNPRRRRSFFLSRLSALKSWAWFKSQSYGSMSVSLVRVGIYMCDFSAWKPKTTSPCFSVPSLGFQNSNHLQNAKLDAICLSFYPKLAYICNLSA